MSRSFRILGQLAVPALLAAFWLAGCSKPDPNTVATVGGEAITKDQLIEEMVRQFRTEKDASMQPLDRRRQVLDNLVERRLKISAARAEGYFDTPEILERRTKFAAEEAINRLYQTEVMDKIVTEDALRWTYDRMGKELKAAHILLKWEDDSSAVRAKARRIRAEIEGGTDFAAAARRYTEEPGGQERAGDLGWFGWGRMVPAFQNAVWDLQVGDVSQPVETRFGVHLIKLEDSRVVENRPPFEDQRTSVLEATRNSFSDSLNLAGKAYLSAMREEEGYKADTEVAGELLTAIHANMQAEKKLADILETLKSQGWEQRVLARWSGGTVDVDGLIEGLGRTFRPTSSIQTREDVLAWIEGTSLFPMLEQRALAQGLDKDPEVERIVDGRIEGIVLTTYERERVKGEVEIGDDAVSAWYEGHLADYMHPQQVRVQEVYVKDKALAEDIARRARAGEDFTALAKANTQRPGRQGTDGVLDPFGPGRYGKMGTAAFELEPDAISDPQPIGNAWSVIKLLERIPPKQKRLDESATSIRMKLEREAREEAKLAWRKEAEAAVPVKIFDERLKELFAD